MKPVNVWDYERLAEEKLDANAHAYFAGGAGDEVTLRDNVAAFERRKLRPRVLVDVETISTATTVLGTEIALPVLIAPLAMQRMAHPDGEQATARAAAAAGTIMCLSSAATCAPAELAQRSTAGSRSTSGGRVRTRRPQSRRRSPAGMRRLSSPSTCRTSGGASAMFASVSRSRSTCRCRASSSVTASTQP